MTGAAGSGGRSLRALLIANDGFSAGHVVRAIAIARGLSRAASRRGIALATVLATTSEAHGLLAREPLALVTLPAPAAARRAGLSDPERRRLVGTALAAAIDSFGPDLIVVDTFPSGPHNELAGLTHRARRALVRRTVTPAAEPRAPAELTAGLDSYDLAILAGDPMPQRVALPIPVVHVPPITLIDAADLVDRAAARAALGIPPHVRAILIVAGGGGDTDAATRTRAIAEAILCTTRDTLPVLALGPLAPESDAVAAAAAGLTAIRTAPLAPLLRAFDGAFAAAGYNTAHELARARVPAALFAQPRDFDDQAARAARFATAGHACALSDLSDRSIIDALSWIATARVPDLEAGGADRAGDALLDLATGARPGGTA